ncbi:MAG: hypothetical protein LBD44_01050 [Spirochaetaceae bacterium]|jgi:hypothetical protein|nr:hypothetical protein [Spirochaetaceae bacterium]
MASSNSGQKFIAKNRAHRVQNRDFSRMAGPLCVDGVITMTPAINKLAKGRPTACLGSIVAGVSPVGIPMSAAVLLCPNVIV